MVRKQMNTHSISPKQEKYALLPKALVKWEKMHACSLLQKPSLCNFQSKWAHNTHIGWNDHINCYIFKHSEQYDNQ